MNEFVTAAPESGLRRSQLYRKQQKAGAEFAGLNGATVVKQFAADDAQQLKSLAMVDLSMLPRSGFKGRQAPQWLTQQGVDIPAAPNRATRQQDGSLVASLSVQEHLILSDLQVTADKPQQLENTWQMDADTACYSLPRSDSHAWLLLTGEHLRDMLAKVCGIDFAAEEFANHQVAQTSVARLNSILIRDDVQLADGSTVLAFHLLCDVSSVEFMWDCLQDAMDEFGGKPAGLAALLA